MERIVAVWPEAYLFSVDEDLRFAHRSVEHKDMSAAVQLSGLDFKSASVCTLAHIWQSSCTSGLFCCYVLSVLYHGDGLKVIGLVERPVNGPVVGYIDPFPAFRGFYVVSFTEVPFLEYRLAALGLCKSCGCCSDCSQYAKYLFHNQSLKGSSAIVGLPFLKAPLSYAFHPRAL